MSKWIDSARQALACMGVGALMFLLPAPAAPKNCEVGSPARGVDADLWGTLRPADRSGESPAQLPNDRDSSNYNGTQRPDDVVYRVPLFTSIDIENGWIFQSYTQGFKIWDATGGNAHNPSLKLTRDCQGSGFLRCLPGQHELRELFWDVDAPDGVDSVVALASAPLGLMIFDTTSKENPRQVYQDYNRGIFQVWSATIGGRHWAFAVDEGFAPGIQLYDMTAALSLNGCIDEPESRGCGPHKGRIGGLRAVSYIDGFRRSDGQFFIAVSPGGRGGLEIWNVTNPQSASRLTTLFGNEFVYGTAIWEQGSKQYLAVQYILPDGAGQGGRIYDITSCLNGNCNGPALVWDKSWRVGASRHFVTYSKSGSKHFLYFGNEDKCSGGLQREWLFDVSNLASGGQPVDLTPPGRKQVTFEGETATVDYWSFYYANNPSGFSEVMPRMGKVNGNYFYRAAWTIFDIHEITGGVPPTASFAWSPAEVYAGDQVTFNDTSIGGTSRTWMFPNQSTSTEASPTYTFTSAGSFPVTLVASNQSGSSTPLTRQVPVLNPAPAGGTVSAAPNPALVCQNVGLTATGVTGRPDTGQQGLDFSWEIVNSNNQVVDSGRGFGQTSFVWDNTGSQPAGTYTGRVTVSNTSGTIQRSTSIQLNPLPTLQFTAQPTCTNCAGSPSAPPAGTATFNAQANGATRWEWDFNADGIIDFDSNATADPTDGPSPTFSYTSTGDKTVRVRISNCQVPGGVTSQDLNIRIAQINPLVINAFSAPCNFSFCEFRVNQPVEFEVDVTGDPSSYQFDWNGDGTYDETVTSVSNKKHSHTYTQTTQSQICPKLKVIRSGEEKVAQVPLCFTIVSGGGNPPPPPPSPQITISGPGSGQPNQALSFSANASNCTPAATWSWSASGGSVSGNGSSVTITWSSTGSKTVTATNSGCAGATGTKAVSISDGGGGGGGGGELSANFTFSPSSPNVGQQVSFNAGSSTGSPTAYSWTFGDGQTGSGATATHTYAAAGTYNVRLDISKSSPSCSFGICTAAVTKQVVVGGGGPPPLQATFTTNASCVTDFGVSSCSARRGDVVSFTSTSVGATTHTWSFGDGGTASGSQVTHVWNTPGNYRVDLTVGNGQTTATSSLSFVITGAPVTPVAKSVVLPWIAQTRGALVQSSDLYIHNPGAQAMDVTLEFRKRGTPETNPPRVTRTIQAGATLFSSDVLRDLFNKENIAGFVTVVVDRGSSEPVITSFNTTVRDGQEFGQTIPGISMSRTGSAATSGAQTLHLTGLNDNDERVSYFGISNPTEQAVTYRLRFFDSEGRSIGNNTPNLTLSRFGQQQFQVRQIREMFGVSDVDDYRVVIEGPSGSQIFPYGANLRLGSEDPSFVGVGERAAKVYLVGVLNTRGINNSLWQTDLVVTNTSSEVVLTDVTFTSVGVNSQPTSPLRLTLQPGETRRLANVIGQQWDVNTGIGVLTLESNAPGGVFPVVQGESYENTRPARRFGQSMMAMTERQAAGANQGQYLVGLRQDNKNRTTLWLFNPSGQQAEYDLVYRNLAGTEIARTRGVRLAPGKMRQISPNQHPLPAAGVQGGFTVQVLVKSGKVLSAAQVVNNVTNDPAYIQGETR